MFCRFSVFVQFQINVQTTVSAPAEAARPKALCAAATGTQTAGEPNSKAAT